MRASLAIPLLCIVAAVQASELTRYDGLCDASAAMALDREHFVVADDERNVLAIYRRGQRKAVASLTLAAHLGTAPDHESDIEGAARIGQRIWWIASHGRKKNGKLHEERHRLFATDIAGTGSPPALVAVPTPYRRLLDDLVAAPALAAYRLKNASERAPESSGGLNIEGLAATPEGTLLIGFRNPLPERRALLVPLLNAAELLAGGGPAHFGTPVLLDLGERGIRSIERVGDGYLIVAGDTADRGRFALFRWSGRAADAPEQLRDVDFKDLRPEALFEIPGTGQAQVLSDDGGIELHGVPCKSRPQAEQSFRSLTLPWR